MGQDTARPINVLTFREVFPNLVPPTMILFKNDRFFKLVLNTIHKLPKVC